jgi:hypothetical protein
MYQTFELFCLRWHDVMDERSKSHARLFIQKEINETNETIALLEAYKETGLNSYIRMFNRSLRRLALLQSLLTPACH